MKRTEIFYTIDHDLVTITGFENVAKPSEIACEFGREVADEYLKQYPRYIRACDKFAVRTGKTFGAVLEKGTELSRQDFGKIINIMKNAGRNLQKIRDEYKSLEIKKVTI